MISILKLADVNGSPRIKMDLPALRIGDPVSLPAFKLERRTPEGRHEVLEVEERIFRVTAVGYDASGGPSRQLLSVDTAMGAPATWRSVKKRPEARRRLPPAVFGRTPI